MRRESYDSLSEADESTDHDSDCIEATGPPAKSMVWVRRAMGKLRAEGDGQLFEEECIAVLREAKAGDKNKPPKWQQMPLEKH